MALFGIPLGLGSYAVTRWGRPPTGPYGRGQQRAWKALAIPLLIVGLLGFVLWLVGWLG